MKHFGDITRIDGAKIPVVDCITGGSPCQGLSIAGKRAGLADDRSGLFMQQIRIVREMRERDKARDRTDHLVRPRFMVWENVPGAFSSGNPKGADFAAVIEEIVKICEPGVGVYISIPDSGWPKSGCYYADDGSWSIAWRVHDAKFWGVPSEENASRLSQILEASPHPKYFLSERACAGILTRAKRRGKKLPEPFEKALLDQASTTH